MTNATLARPPVDLAALTPKEMKALEEMREIFKNETYPDQEDANSWFQLEDFTYLRYLRARKFEVDKAEKMLRDTLDVRRKHSPHKMDPNEPALRAILNLKFWRLLPMTKQGSSTLFTYVGLFDANDIVDEAAYERYLILNVELGCRLLHQNGWKSTQLTVIFDFENFSLMKQASAKGMRLIKMLMSNYDLNYPEMLLKSIMLNAPFLFRGPYAVLRPLLAKETEAKIQFVSNVKVLDDILEKEQRCPNHGGTRAEDYPSIFYEQ